MYNARTTYIPHRGFALHSIIIMTINFYKLVIEFVCVSVLYFCSSLLGDPEAPVPSKHQNQRQPHDEDLLIVPDQFYFPSKLACMQAERKNQLVYVTPVHGCG